MSHPRAASCVFYGAIGIAATILDGGHAFGPVFFAMVVTAAISDALATWREREKAAKLKATHPTPRPKMAV